MLHGSRPSSALASFTFALKIWIYIDYRNAVIIIKNRCPIDIGNGQMDCEEARKEVIDGKVVARVYFFYILGWATTDGSLPRKIEQPSIDTNDKMLSIWRDSMFIG